MGGGEGEVGILGVVWFVIVSRGQVKWPVWAAGSMIVLPSNPIWLDLVEECIAEERQRELVRRYSGLH